MKLYNFIETCLACPSQWEAVDEHGQFVYIRYRHGILRVDMDGETIFENDEGLGETDGYISEEKMLEAVGAIVVTRKYGAI